MSKISDISTQYKNSLKASQKDYEDLYEERAKATEEFYNNFFKDLVRKYIDNFNNNRYRERLQEIIRNKLGTDELNFIAIDGTCSKDQFSDMITFFGGAYGAKGVINLDSGEHKIKYKRWSLDQDVSMVAWVPIPFARLDEVIEKKEEFLLTEEEKINLSSVHTKIMQLAEIFLAFNTISSSVLEAPNILLMDTSPSSVLASVAHSQEDIGLKGYPYDRRELTSADISIALAHPFSDDLDIPLITKEMDRGNAIIKMIHNNPTQKINTRDLSQTWEIEKNKLDKTCKFLENKGVLNKVNDNEYYSQINPQESWDYTKALYQNICKKLFINKDQNALQYEIEDDNGIKRRRWMSPQDIEFLIAVGMRMLIEECWNRNVLYYGVVKDSSNRYLTRNYLGVAIEKGLYPELENLEISLLPWTDRIFCETLPLVDEDLNTPWTTIEFDSAFMTLHREKEENSDRTQIAGILGRIVNKEKLFAKSLGQFFLKRDKATPLMGHVVFLERLISPLFDNSTDESGPLPIEISTNDLGKLEVFTWLNNLRKNIAQDIMIYLLSVLAKNHYADAIGYPDPLHKADQGAKTIGRSVANIVKSSTVFLKSRPLSKTFRSIRDSIRK